MGTTQEKHAPWQYREKFNRISPTFCDGPGDVEMPIVHLAQFVDDCEMCDLWPLRTVHDIDPSIQLLRTIFLTMFAGHAMWTEFHKWILHPKPKLGLSFPILYRRELYRRVCWIDGNGATTMERCPRGSTTPLISTWLSSTSIFTTGSLLTWFPFGLVSLVAPFGCATRCSDRTPQFRSQCLSPT